VGRINERWRQLHAHEKEWAERAVQYLFLTNAGGDIATLSFLGASEKAFNRTGLKWSSALFVGGLILVGFVIAKTYYHMSGLFKHYRRAVDSYFHDQITWDDMNRQDARRSEDKFVGHVLPWAAFLFFRPRMHRRRVQFVWVTSGDHSFFLFFSSILRPSLVFSLT
jgi:hypothetical protein